MKYRVIVELLLTNIGGVDTVPELRAQYPVLDFDVLNFLHQLGNDDPGKENEKWVKNYF